MHTHFVFTSLSSSMSLMMLLPSNTVPWGLGKPDQWSALDCWNRAQICARRSLFSFSSLLQVSSLSSSCLNSLWWSSRRQATDDVSVCTRVIRLLRSVCIWQICEGINRHRKQDHTPGTYSSFSAMQSAWIHEEHWQQRTISLPACCLSYLHPSRQRSDALISVLSCIIRQLCKPRS